ncbi:MAG: hypothetical protein GEU89_19715 [Kiloniellaceae bacterium]|nr:hypothetical protein [Kiloniellaceae bacterium]
MLQQASLPARFARGIAAASKTGLNQGLAGQLIALARLRLNSIYDLPIAIGRKADIHRLLSFEFATKVFSDEEVRAILSDVGFEAAQAVKGIFWRLQRSLENERSR